MEKQPDIMTAPEVAELLRISLWSVYELSRRDEIPHFRVGRCKRFIRADVLAWAASSGGQS